MAKKDLLYLKVRQLHLQNSPGSLSELRSEMSGFKELSKEEQETYYKELKEYWEIYHGRAYDMPAGAFFGLKK